MRGRHYITYSSRSKSNLLYYLGIPVISLAETLHVFLCGKKLLRCIRFGEHTVPSAYLGIFPIDMQKVAFVSDVALIVSPSLMFSGFYLSAQLMERKWAASRASSCADQYQIFTLVRIRLTRKLKMLFSSIWPVFSKDPIRLLYENLHLICFSAQHFFFFVFRNNY